MKLQSLTSAFAFVICTALCTIAAAQQAKPTKSDQVRAAIQEICPVSGQKLGAHGEPIKVKIGGEIMFLCCESCKSGKVKKEHWAHIHQNLANAQAKCLVMGKPLPKDAKSVNVNGQIIYVCCPPCIEKIRAAPREHLQQLLKIQTAYIQQRQQGPPQQHHTPSHSASESHVDAHALTSDQIRASVQGICPVSGLELGAHGTPVKVSIGGQEVFVCCESCKNGKVKKEHWARIHQNLAKAQAKCFVMDNPLPKKPEWVIVKGQLIYVCCPPCIEKIKASPEKYLKQLAATQAAFLKSRTATASTERHSDAR